MKATHLKNGTTIQCYDAESSRLEGKRLLLWVSFRCSIYLYIIDSDESKMERKLFDTAHSLYLHKAPARLAKVAVDGIGQDDGF